MPLTVAFLVVEQITASLNKIKYKLTKNKQQEITHKKLISLKMKSMLDNYFQKSNNSFLHNMIIYVSKLKYFTFRSIINL